MFARAWHTVGAHALHGLIHPWYPLPGPKVGGVVLGYRAGSSGVQGRETPRAQHSLSRAPMGGGGGGPGIHLSQRAWAGLIYGKGVRSA